jgi:uncharacterized damage-inducible protein DinB
MTKNYFIQLADYNIWANNIVHSWFEKISDEQWSQPVVSSFNSIAETTLHVAAAETVWLDRLNEEEAPRLLAATFKGSKKELQNHWKKTSGELKSFIENFDETRMHDSVNFKRPDGNTYELAFFKIFAHVFNHTTYHRGQFVTMLRQIGFTDVHSIDMSTYFWSKKN